MTTRAFQIGDRVKATFGWSIVGIHKGDVGTVMAEVIAGYYNVSFGPNKNYRYKAHEMELIPDPIDQLIEAIYD